MNNETQNKTSTGWSRSQRNWIYRIAKSAHKKSCRCQKRAKFWGYWSKKLVHHEPDGIWRYCMIMYGAWIKCADIWGDIADQFVETLHEIDHPKTA